VYAQPNAERRQRNQPATVGCARPASRHAVQAARTTTGPASKARRLAIRS
jgi:hypothetical protein